MQAGPVLLADADEGFRAAVACLVEAAGLTVIAVASGDEALARAREQRPSAVLLDVELRSPSGYQTCRALRKLYGEALPILFVSAKRTKPSDRVAGLLIGADDYLSKPADLDELIARITRAHHRFVATGDPQAEPPASIEGVKLLTPREAQILRMLAAGRSPPEIATELVVSPKTVSSHLQHILTKLSVHSRTQAVARAYELGIVLPPGDELLPPDG